MHSGGKLGLFNDPVIANVLQVVKKKTVTIDSPKARIFMHYNVAMVSDNYFKIPSTKKKEQT